MSGGSAHAVREESETARNLSILPGVEPSRSRPAADRRLARRPAVAATGRALRSQFPANRPTMLSFPTLQACLAPTIECDSP